MNGIARAQTVARSLAVALSCALLLVGCTDDGYDEHRTQYTVSSQRVEVSGVELTFESCSLPQQCDFLFQIANNSDRCIAFSDILLPGYDYVWLDTTFNALPRITAQPVERVRQTFVVLQPGDALRQSIDLRAISNIPDLANSSITMTTGFIECSRFTGTGDYFELVSAPITFERVP